MSANMAVPAAAAAAPRKPRREIMCSADPQKFLKMLTITSQKLSATPRSAFSQISLADC